MITPHGLSTVLISALALGAAGTAQASLIVGFDDSVESVFAVDPASGASTSLFSSVGGAWGMAYDPVGGYLYFNNGSTLLRSTPTVGAVPQSLGTMTNSAGDIQAFVGFAWANGKLYGTKNIAEEAVWEIDVATRIAAVVYDYVDSDYDFGGFDYNPANGLFYGTSDTSGPQGIGLFSIDVFGAGGIVKVADYPIGSTDIDGLAIGNGIAYMVEDEAGGKIFRFDLGSGTYLDSFDVPLTGQEVFSSAAFVPDATVPEPGTVALLGLGLAGLAATRRRKR